MANFAGWILYCASCSLRTTPLQCTTDHCQFTGTRRRDLITPVLYANSIAHLPIRERVKFKVTCRQSLIAASCPTALGALCDQLTFLTCVVPIGVDLAGLLGGTHGERRRWVRVEWGGIWGGVSPLQPTKGSGGAS